MSFILDALKKSETERQRQASPETAYIPTSGGNSRPGRWIWIVGALLLANVVALTFVVLRPAAPVPADRASSAEPAGQADTLAATGEAALPPIPEPQAPPPRSSAAATGNPPAQQSMTPAAVAATAKAEATTEYADTQVRPVMAENPPAVDPPAMQVSPAASGPEFKTYSEALIDGLQVADLHLDIHVYSDTPSERFVFVNMSKYREGDVLDEGPSVRAIRPDGLLLEYRDTLFLLPRE